MPQNKRKPYIQRSFDRKRKFSPLKMFYRDFPGGAVVKNLPANAGDMCSSPGLGRSPIPPSN